MERKTSLAARLQRLGPFPDSQTAGPDASQAPPAPTQPADANPAALQQQQQQQQPKRRLPQWLAPPPPAPDPAPSAVPQQQLQPKVSIRARVAAASAAAPLGVSSPDPATPAAAAATAVADKAPAGTSLLGRSSDGTKALPGAAAVVGVPGSRVHAGEGQKVSLAARLAMPRTYSLAPAMPAPEANPGPAATAAPAAASSQQALGAGRQQVSQAGLALQPTQQNEPQQQEEQQQPGEPEQQQHSPANHHPQLLLGTDASLWESESDAEQEQRTGQAAPDPRQQQEQQQQQQQPLTLQQRQQRQMAQLGLKLPGAGGGADEDAWLREVFASAGSGGRSRKKGAGASGGRSGGGAAAAGGGSGGRSGGAAAAAAAGGSSGHSRARASSGGAAAGSGGAAAAGHAHLGAAAAEDDIEAAAAAAAAGAGAVGGEEGVAADPLVLFDEEANLRLQVPGSINQHLRSYQREGVQFLFSRYAAGSGGVLCDDMGLGKTVQAISFIAALLGKQGTPQDAHPRSFAAYRRQRQQQRHLRRQLCGDDSNSGEEDEPVEDAGSTLRWPVLVVCPTSVLDNWMRELNMWGTFKAIKYHGPPAVREGIAEQASDGRFEVILTSYDTLRVDAAALASLHPHAVVFDEAHKLKNAKSKQYEAAASLPTKYRYGLSGTIMQNDWDELFAVLDLLCPYCLGEYGGFVEYYSKPIKRGQSSTASNYEVVKGEKRRRQLVEVVKKVALRRTKAIISDQLPRKTDNVVFCQLQPLQYRAYDRTLASPDLQALRLAKSPCDCGSGLKSGECCHGMVPASEGGVLWPHYHECNCRLANCNRHRPLGCQEYYESQGYNNPRLRCPYCLMLPAISLLTKISNHLELIRPDAKLQQQDERQFEFELAVARMVLGDDAHQLGGLLANSSGWLGASDETHCGKMATLKLLLGTWASDYSCNNKVLLFSHSTRCLDLLEAFVQRQGYDYVRLDGSTPQKLRQGICDEFNSRPSIFLLLMSTVAGGLGLNLTAANKVVVFDPSWNPAHDLQAQDRAYRLGQTRDVAVYRLVGTGTLEEAVYKRQIYKQQQSNMVIDAQEEPRYWEGVQGDTDKPGELWGLWNLLRFSGQTVETRDILQAYQGRHRQQIEQQLQDDARRQQQQQPAGVQPSGAGAAAAAGAPAAAAAKPFKIIMVDDLVGDAGDSAVLEGAPGFEGAAASGGGGSSRRGGRGSGDGSRKRHGSDDAGGCTSDAGEGEAGAPGAAADAGAGAGDGVGGMAVSEAAWCDEALLGGLLDELLPGDGTLPGSQQQLRQGRRKRRHTILSDSEDEGGAAAGAAAGERHHARGAGGPAGALRGLSPVSEEEEEVGSELCDSMAGASEEPGLSTDSAGGFEEPVVAVDPVLAALEQQGAILHAHRHEKVLGKAKKPRAAQQQQHDSQHSSQPGSQPQRRRGQQQRPARQQDDSLGDPSNLLRRSVAAACSGLCPSAAAAAEAAADKGWGPVASLAVWQGVGVVEMAEWLLQLTAEQRQQVLEMYSDDLL